TLVSIFAAFSPNIWVFVGLRFIQGFTGAAGIVIARASARDMYTGKDLTKFIALLALVNGAAPIIAPIFGGALLNWVSWHVVFLILGAIGLVMFLRLVSRWRKRCHRSKDRKVMCLPSLELFLICYGIAYL